MVKKTRRGGPRPVGEQLAQVAENLPPPNSATRDELRRRLTESKQPSTEVQWPAILEEPRSKVDTRYGEPPTSHRPWVGPAVVFAKRAFRRGFQPFINEVLRKQVEFNEAILHALMLVYETQREQRRSQLEQLTQLRTLSTELAELRRNRTASKA